MTSCSEPVITMCLQSLGSQSLRVCVCVCVHRPLKVQSVSAAGSVQERIQRSIGSVQRTNAALDRHFLQK